MEVSGTVRIFGRRDEDGEDHVLPNSEHIRNVQRQESFHKRNEEGIQAGRRKETDTGRTQPTMEGVCKKEKSRKDGEVTWQQMDQLRSAPS